MTAYINNLLNPLRRRLVTAGSLPEEGAELMITHFSRVREVHRGEYLAREGDKLQTTIILSGWAARFDLSPEGRRRITALLLPGDITDVCYTSTTRRDDYLVAVSACHITTLTAESVGGLVRTGAALEHFFRETVCFELATARRWLLRGGRGDAFSALCHFLSEMHARALIAGIGDEASFPMPLPQFVIGDALGLTAVHINRCLRRIREAGLATVGRDGVHVHDLAGMRRIGNFNAAYLDTGAGVEETQSS